MSNRLLLGERMKLSMPPFEQATVLVVGDVMLDRYWHGGTSRISPEAPVPVVKINQQEDRPGGAANVALNIAALGAQTWLIGATGEDEAADSLTDSLNSTDVKTFFQRIKSQPTTIKLRVMSRHQQLIRVDFEEAFQINKEALAIDVADLLPSAKILLLSDYGKGTLQNHQELIKLAKEHHVPVLVDPKGNDFSIYRGATLLTPNLSEFEAVVGKCLDENQLIEKAQQLIKEIALEALLITRGEHGMTLIRQNHQVLHLPARAQEVFDVTGAGDTVISTLAASLAAGLEMAEAVSLSNLAASIVVAKLGTACISAPELRRAIQRDTGNGKGVVSLDQLLIAIEDARAQGEKIVFTNGCFDILHAGHVAYLEQARSLGGRLIVAINDDASVTKLKGLGRPINTVDRRMAVLAGLGAVDWVTCFSGDTPENLLEKIKPDVLVKGGDYTVDEVVGADIVKAYGGEVYVLGLVENSSTTAIVNKIKGQ